jgi:hypothetical protein
MSSLKSISNEIWNKAAAGADQSTDMLKLLTVPLYEYWWWDFVI